MSSALEEKPSHDRVERLAADNRAELRKEIHDFKFQVMFAMWIIVASTVVNVIVSVLKH